MPDVSAVIVNWNTSNLLDDCLESLALHGTPDPMEVVVVDNGSTDGSLPLLRAKWPTVTVIANRDNEGYTRANNQGIRATSGAELLLINTDARLEPGCLERLLGRMASDPGAAVVGPRLVYGDGSWQRWTAGRAPSLFSVAAYTFGLDRVLGRWRPGLGLYLGADVCEPFQPEWVSSACMLVRREALYDIGLMDESFFCYMDDVDLCQRARDRDWRVWYEPSALAVHLMGGASGTQRGAASPAALAAFARYFERHHGRGAANVLRGVQILGFAGRAAAYGVASLAGQGPARRSRARAHWTHLRLVRSARARSRGEQPARAIRPALSRPLPAASTEPGTSRSKEQKSMQILVTGAAGMLGSGVVPALVRAGHDVLPTDLAGVPAGWNGHAPSPVPLDVRSAVEVNSAVEGYAPELVVHLAAITDLEDCERDPDGAFATNALGTKHVALACARAGIPMVYVSTAGVFDGESDRPYTEFDTPNPINVYGHSKFEGERYVQWFVDRFYTIRAGWMVGGGAKDHKFVAKILAQIHAGTPRLHVVGDKLGTPTYVPDFARCLLTLIESHSYGLYHMACGGQGSRLSVCARILEVLGRDDIELIEVGSEFFAEEFFAPRPRSEIMRNLVLDLQGMNTMRPWAEAIEDYLSHDLAELGKGVRRTLDLVTRAEAVPAI